MTDREKLTDEERAVLGAKCSSPLPAKALRIIDAHEADRAALVKERDAARHQSEERFEAMTALSHEVTRLTAEHQQAIEDWRAAAEGQRDRGNALETEVARLTRERDEARDDVRAAHQAHANAVNAKQAEVTRLTQERDEARAKVSERDDIWRRRQDNWRESSQAEVARLTEALAAAERKSDGRHTANLALCASLKASGDARMAAEQKLAAAEHAIHESNRVSENAIRSRDAAEQKLAGAERERDENAAAWTVQWDRANAAEARARELEADLEVANNFRDARESELAQLRERVAKATQRLTYDEELLPETRIARALEVLSDGQ